MAQLVSAGGAAASDAFVSLLLERTEGNPFFIEKILRQVAASIA